MPNKEKIKAVESAKEVLQGAKSVVVSHYRNLSVGEANELRKKLREAQAIHKVMKNTLVARAARETNLEPLVEFLEGPTVLTVSKGDMVASAKVLADFSKEHENFKILGGVLEGKKASKEDFLAISQLPSREVLLGKLAGSLQSPITKLVRVLDGPLRGLAIALKAVADKKQTA